MTTHMRPTTTVRERNDSHDQSGEKPIAPYCAIQLESHRLNAARHGEFRNLHPFVNVSVHGRTISCQRL